VQTRPAGLRRAARLRVDLPCWSHQCQENALQEVRQGNPYHEIGHTREAKDVKNRPTVLVIYEPK
jgi:hypothetical protein